MAKVGKRRKTANKQSTTLTTAQAKRLKGRLEVWEKRIQRKREAVAKSESLSEADFAVMINTRA